MTTMPISRRTSTIATVAALLQSVLRPFGRAQRTDVDLTTMRSADGRASSSADLAREHAFVAETNTMLIPNVHGFARLAADSASVDEIARRMAA